MKKTVLLVDDELCITKALSRVLSAAGVSVKTANSAKEALEILESWHCRVVLTDFRMPEVDGGALLSMIKQRYPDVIGMVLSGYADFNSVKNLLNAGTVFRFLEKPWEDEELVSEINSALNFYEDRMFKQHASQILLSSNDAVLELDDTGRITRANVNASLLFNKSEGLVGTRFNEHVSTADIDKVPLLSKGMDGFSTFLNLENGQEVELTCRYAAPSGSVIELAHITEVVLSSTIFDLPSILTYKQLLTAIHHELETHETLSLVSIKASNFEYWSRLAGFAHAHSVFEDLSQNVLDAFSPIGQLAYLSNEQFIAVIPNCCDEFVLIEKINNALDFILGNKGNSGFSPEFNVCYSILPEDGNDPRVLVNNLLLCVSSDSEIKINSFLRCDTDTVQRRKSQSAIISALHCVTEKQQLYLNFQPKVNLKSSTHFGAEVLVRWTHPEFGQIPPSLFIPLAEQNGHIVEIGYWILNHALDIMARWTREGINFGKLAINISGKQLSQPDFVNRVRSIIAQTGVDPQQLEFELTESCLVDNISESCLKLTELAQLGIRIAIDDFGTGFSSLTYLSKLPVHEVKIDRSFVSDIESSVVNQNLLANIVRLVHCLNLKVVVEGVETEEQLSILNSFGCDYIQGYLISKPLSEQEYVSFMG